MKHRSSRFGVASLRFQDDGLIDDSRSLAESFSSRSKPGGFKVAGPQGFDDGKVQGKWLNPRAAAPIRQPLKQRTRVWQEDVSRPASLHCSPLHGSGCFHYGLHAGSAAVVIDDISDLVVGGDGVSTRHKGKSMPASSISNQAAEATGVGVILDVDAQAELHREGEVILAECVVKLRAEGLRQHASDRHLQGRRRPSA